MHLEFRQLDKSLKHKSSESSKELKNYIFLQKINPYEKTIILYGTLKQIQEND